jgi:hypothetical protein
MRRWLLITFLLLAAALTIAGCGGSEACTPESASTAHTALRRSLDDFINTGLLINNAYTTDMAQAIIDDLTDQYDEAARMRLPVCAEEAHQAMLSAMEAAIRVTEMRVNDGNPDEIERITAEVESHLIEYMAAMDILAGEFAVIP